MKLDLGDGLELAGLVLLVAAVWCATGRLWAVLVAAGVGLLWLRHTWVWDGQKPAETEPIPGKPKPIVRNRRMW